MTQAAAATKVGAGSGEVVLSILLYSAILLTVTAAFAYFNHYAVRLPRNTGLLVLALVVSVALRLIETYDPSISLARSIGEQLDRADLGPLLLDGALAFLLFAGAIEVDVQNLLSRKWTILALATVGVLLSTLFIGTGMYWVFQ